jgi:hypothetical protein
MQRSCKDGGSGAMTGLATVFGPDKLDAIKLGGFEAELLAHFLADAAEGGGLKLDFGWNDLFALDGKVIRDARRAGLLRTLPVIPDLSRRSLVCGIGGGCFFCRVGIQQEFELRRIELLARHAEHASGQRVDGLAKHLDLRGLTLDDDIASGDFIKQVLAFGVVHFRQDQKQSTCHEDM